MEVCTPDHEFLNGWTELLLDGGRVSSGFLIGEGAYNSLPHRKWLLLLLLQLLDGLWGPHGLLTCRFVLLPKESCQGQVLGLGVYGLEKIKMSENGSTYNLVIWWAMKHN